MNEATTSGPDTFASSNPLDGGAGMSSDRLTQFQEEVGKLKVTGGGANPERLAGKWGIGLTIVGFVIGFVSWWSALNATTFEDIHRAAIMALLGVGVAIVGIVIWLRNSLSRYLRYWLIRLVYEQREQTERLIEAQRTVNMHDR